DALDRAAADLGDVVWNNAGDGMLQSLRLQVPGDPLGLRRAQNRIDVRFAGSERTEVQIRRVLQMTRVPGLVELDVEHALRDHAPVAPISDGAAARTAARGDSILHGVFEVEHDTRRAARI